MGPRIKMALVVAIAITTAAVCNARVFWKWDSTSESARTLESMGGTSAYHADISLNGGKGVLSVFSFERPLAELVAELARAFSIKTPAARDGSMWLGEVTTKNKTIKFLVLRLGPQGKTVLFQMEQSAADAKLAMQAPERHYLQAVPVFPDSKPMFFASDANAGMSMEVSGTGADAQAVAGFFDSSLKAQGWSRPLAPEGMAVPSAMAVFVRKQDVCCVLTDAPEGSSQTRITILHKQRGMK